MHDQGRDISAGAGETRVGERRRHRVPNQHAACDAAATGGLAAHGNFSVRIGGQRRDEVVAALSGADLQTGPHVTGSADLSHIAVRERAADVDGTPEGLVFDSVCCAINAVAQLAPRIG